MNKTPYIVQLAAFSAIWAAIVLIIQKTAPGPYIHQAIWGILAFHVVLTWLSHLLTANALKKSQGAFTTAVFGSIGLKMLLSVAFIIFYLLYDRSNSTWFSINFVALYLFFTAFEIKTLLRNLRDS